MVSATRRSSRRPEKRSVDAAEISDSGNESDFIDEGYESPLEENQKRARGHKRARTSFEPDPDFVENNLYIALSNSECAVSDLALEWVEQWMSDFESNKSEAITELFNLVLRCCGCYHLAQEHDMINYDSADATVADIAVFFERQRYHEYPFISKNKDLKFFRQNVIEFFENIITVSHEKGCLYKEQDTGDSSLASPMMNDILSWLAALSSSTIRPFRFVSTVVHMAIQTQICEQAVSLSISLEKQLRQLNNAKNNKTKRNQRAQDRKIEIISETIQSFKLQHDTLIEYLGDVFLNVFVHRYRDIDSAIRVECLRALGNWMIINESMFFQAKYLRYFGWLISDPNDSVREEAIKIIHKLYKHISARNETMGIGFRQFTERFKKQFILMVWSEQQMSIRIHLFGIYTELFKLGFLETSDILDIGLFGFFLAEMTHALSNKAKKEWCKFAEAVCLEQLTSEMEKFESFFSTHFSHQFGEEEDQLNLSTCLRYKALILFLQTSFQDYTGSKRSLVSVSPTKPFPDDLISDLFLVMYSLPSFQGSWEVLVQYLLCDISSVSFGTIDNTNDDYDRVTEQTLKERLEITRGAEKNAFLSLILGSFICILSKKNSRKQEESHSSDNISNALPVLALYLSDLERLLSNSVDSYIVFLRLFNLLLSLEISFAQVFANMEKEVIYNGLQGRILSMFADIDEQNEHIKAVFDDYFLILLGSYEDQRRERVSNPALNSSIQLKLEDLIISLSSEAIEALNENGPMEDFVEEDEEFDLPPDQKVLCNKMMKANASILKLSQLEKVMNINKFIAEPILNLENSLLEVLQTKVLSNVEFQSLIKFWPNNYLKILTEMQSCWSATLDLIALSLCWKLEDLMYASNDDSAASINIGMFLDEHCLLLRDVSRIFISVDESLKGLNSTTSDSDGAMTKLIRKLIDLEKVFSLKITDVIVSLRTFYRKLKERNVFKHFEEIFESNERLGPYIQDNMHTGLQSALLNVFFIQESKLAKARNISLERGELDDINYDDYIDSIEDELSKDEEKDKETEIFFEATAFASSDIEDDAEDDGRGFDPTVAERAQEATAKAKRSAREEQIIWGIEKDLCVYSVKLLSMSKVDAFPAIVIKRILLNGQKFGGLFGKIVDDELNQESRTTRIDNEETAQAVTTETEGS